MRKIRIIISVILISILYSCHEKQSPSLNTQTLFFTDLNYREGKWYSVTPPTNQSVSPYLDTIWFINDTLAGWSAFVPDSPYAYSFRKTYFPDHYHIAMIAQDPLVLGKKDTGLYQCGMSSSSSDTFNILWENGPFTYTEQSYVKKTN